MSDKNTAALLLRSTETLLDLQQQRQREQGGAFNVFSILKLNERAHCRVIYELLRPDGSHAMGDVFLLAGDQHHCRGAKPLPLDGKTGFG